MEKTTALSNSSDLLRFFRDNAQKSFSEREIFDLFSFVFFKKRRARNILRGLYNRQEIIKINKERVYFSPPKWVYQYKIKKEVWYNRAFVAKIGKVKKADWNMLFKHYELDCIPDMRKFPINTSMQDILWKTKVVDSNSEARKLNLYNVEIPYGIKKWKTGKILFYTVKGT